MTEEWRPVTGWPYEISSEGRVRRAALHRYRNSRPDGLLKGTPGRGGYLRVNLSDWPGTGRRGGITRPIHTLVCEAFYGPRPSSRHQGAHRNGRKRDNRAENLYWATPEENERDKTFHRTAVVGSLHPLARLREEDVVAIRALWATGRFPQTRIAELFDVSRGKVWQILHGRSWRHVA